MLSKTVRLGVGARANYKHWTRWKAVSGVSTSASFADPTHSLFSQRTTLSTVNPRLCTDVQNVRFFSVGPGLFNAAAVASEEIDSVLLDPLVPNHSISQNIPPRNWPLEETTAVAQDPLVPNHAIPENAVELLEEATATPAGEEAAIDVLEGAIDNVLRMEEQLPPEVGAPDVVAKEVGAPDVVSPEVAVPDVMVPEVVTPDVVAPADIATTLFEAPVETPLGSAVEATKSVFVETTASTGADAFQSTEEAVRLTEAATESISPQVANLTVVSLDNVTTQYI